MYYKGAGLIRICGWEPEKQEEDVRMPHQISIHPSILPGVLVRSQLRAGPEEEGREGGNLNLAY